MKRIFTYLMILFAGITLSSCNKEVNETTSFEENTGIPIEFSFTDVKSVFDAEGKITWVDGDQIGLFHYVNGKPSENADNVPYTYSAQTGKFHLGDVKAVWSGTEEDQHNIYVYYPYRAYANENDSEMKASGLFVSHTSNQTYDAGASQWSLGARNSFAYGSAENVTFAQPVSFNPMSQFLSVVRLNIANDTGEDVVVSNVQVNCTKQLKAGIRVDITNGGIEVLNSGDVNTINVTVENGSVAAGQSIDVRLMVRPSDFSSDTFTVKVTSDKGVHPDITFTGGKLDKGSRVSKNITLSKIPDSFSIGDAVAGGILYQILDGGSTGMVVYPYTESANNYFSNLPNQALSSYPSSKTDGVANVNKLKEIDPELTTFTSAAYCDALPGDWYLPARDELRALFEVYNGTLYDDATVEVPANITQAEKDARARFDAYITENYPDGQVLNLSAASENGTQYFSSTLGGNGKSVHVVRFGKKDSQATAVYMSKELGGTTDNRAKARTRCVKRVDLTNVEESIVNFNEAGQEGGYDVYLLIGQSNMAGRGELTSADQIPAEGVYILNASGSVSQAVNPLNKYSTIRKDSEQKMGPGWSFAQTIYAQTGRKVLLVVNARGGSSINYWVKGKKYTYSDDMSNFAVSGDHYLYDESIARAKQALQYGTLKGIIWHQGESDKTDTGYMTKLSTLVSSLRSDLADVPFVAGQIGSWKSENDAFNQLIMTISDNISNSDCVSSAGVTHGGDNIHFNRAAQLILGERYAQKILKMVYNKDIIVE